jgi:hypothetical protein
MVSRTLSSPTYPAQHENPAWSVIKTWLIITPPDPACNAAFEALLQDAGFAFQRESGHCRSWLSVSFRPAVALFGE